MNTSRAARTTAVFTSAGSYRARVRLEFVDDPLRRRSLYIDLHWLTAEN